MCACDEEIGKKFLPHQLSAGKRLESQERVPVTAGFIPLICDECRGLPPTPCPKAATVGHTSKIKRYYWRELTFREFELFEQLEGNPRNYIHEIGEHESEAVQQAKKQALIDIKKLHSLNPKYDYSEESNEEFIRRSGIKIRVIEGIPFKTDTRKAKIVHNDSILTPEEYAARIYQDQGYQAIFLESVPFHVIFAVFTWILIQDPSDPQVRQAGFGERAAYEKDGSKNLIWTPLPSDFGTGSYATRRKNQTDKHLFNIKEHEPEILWLFDYWLPYSEGLRQYLWAHKDEHVDKARKVVEILEPATTFRIVRYLLHNYWQRFLGWPDLLVYNNDEYIFVEVKLSKDKFSEEQRSWIENNHKELHLPFEVIKIYRIGR